MPKSETMERVERLEARVNALEATLGTLIQWMAQSSNSPINIGEAKELLNMIVPEEIH
jgi:hypothetical protein